MQMSQSGTSTDPDLAVRPITVENLVAMITGVLQHQQAQQQLPPPPPVVVRTPASIVTDFCKISPPTFMGEGDPILVEKWEEQIVKHLDLLEVPDDVTQIRLATF